MLKKYYDWDNNKILGNPIEIKAENEDGYTSYSYESEKDELIIVKYTYALEWEVVKKQ